MTNPCRPEGRRYTTVTRRRLRVRWSKGTNRLGSVVEPQVKAEEKAVAV